LVRTKLVRSRLLTRLWNMPQPPKIIMLSEVLETRVRKQKELEFYQKELEKLQEKMFFIQKDIDITNLIIDMIEKENVVDFQQHLLDKKKDE
jgi:hypothetical protein